MVASTPIADRRPMTKPAAAVTGRTVENLADFIRAISEYSTTTPNLKCYRGQRDASWRNVAGIFRNDLSELARNEKRAIRDLISVHPNEFVSDQTMFDKLVRMQHFGLPTRLLDVTLNALVALYFAVDPGQDGAKSDGKVMAFAVPPEHEKYFDSDSVSCVSNLANLTQEEKEEINRYCTRHAYPAFRIDDRDRRIKMFNDLHVIKRLHQFIRAEKPYFLPIIDYFDLFRLSYVHPKMSNRRIIAQSGAFIIFGLWRSLNRANFGHPIEETPFVIPEGKKKDIRLALEELGINEGTLYPEIDRAAKRIKDRYIRA